MALKVRAFSGFAKSGYTEPGWKIGGTNAAFFVSVFRNLYGDEFGFAELQDFKRGNGIDDWEPSDDLLADGTLVAEDGVLYIPEGFETKGWSDLYTQWKNGVSVATAPQAPAPAPIPPAQTPASPTPMPSPDASYDFNDYSWDEEPQTITPQQAPGGSAPGGAAPQPIPAAISSAPAGAAAAAAASNKPGKQMDMMPVLLIGGAVAAFLFLSKKPSRRK